jgi:hypothetical protein
VPVSSRQVSELQSELRALEQYRVSMHSVASLSGYGSALVRRGSDDSAALERMRAAVLGTSASKPSTPAPPLTPITPLALSLSPAPAPLRSR